MGVLEVISDGCVVDVVVLAVFGDGHDEVVVFGVFGEGSMLFLVLVGGIYLKVVVVLVVGSCWCLVSVHRLLVVVALDDGAGATACYPRMAPTTHHQ